MGRVYQPNGLFRSARERLPSPSGAPRPMSRRELADAVNTLLWEKEGIKEHLSQDDIGKVENGRVRWPRKARRLGFRAVLRARTDADLGFYFYREAAGPAICPSSPEGHAGWVTAALNAGPPHVGQPTRPQAHANNSDLPAANLGKLLGHSAAEALEFAPRTGASCLDPRTIEHLHPLCPTLLCSQTTASVLPLLVAGGRTHAGSVINARILPAADDGRIVAALPQGGADSGAPGWPGRELLVGVVERGTHVDAFGIDSRRAGLQVATAEARLPIPRAYQLDDLTVGLLWAVTNLETSLLGDDAQLAACHGWISQYESLPHSSASRDAVASPNITDVAR
ncbi:hypothetical protein JQS43_22085 [Natronosporangium hydrolyticum]|uniref:Uncharacterized protein n=1 Tax=Natronosporangium hydrolyticum TaxID=2811111 RepID=A0A895YFJ1_9ACTN|nr:hypothetical protein [Natronosporangium hydrolyticum]QSB14183.1 hypothetical protein JQS43_22085 [Natronosporangium hydrolyticum]